MKLLQHSTRQFISEARGVKGYSLFDFIHGYIYSRFPYLYIGTGIGEHKQAKVLLSVVQFFGRILAPVNQLWKRAFPPKVEIQFADTYHGKVVPITAAKKLLTIQQEIRLENLEHVIPYQKARDLIMLEPTHIAVLDCPCRAARKNPCLPMDVCLIVGEPFVGMLLDYRPQQARRITQEEALQILEAEDARGHVHHAFFKDAMLGRFYAICNCCSCCCGAMQAHQQGTPMLASSGYLAEVDADLCIGCESCMDYCQFHAISVPEATAIIDPNACMGCGVCTSHCSQDAIHLERNADKGIPLELDELINSVMKPVSAS